MELLLQHPWLILLIALALSAVGGSVVGVTKGLKETQRIQPLRHGILIWAGRGLCGVGYILIIPGFFICLFKWIGWMSKSP